MLQFHPVRLFILACMLLFLTACQGTAPASQPPTTGTEGGSAASTGSVQGRQSDLPDIGPIQIGYLPITGNAPIFVAQEKGYFAEQGLEVELVSFQSGAEMIALLSTGHLDLGVGDGGVGMFNALASELPIKIGAGFIQLPEDNENPTLFIVVRKELFDSGEVVDISALAGRKVAMNALRGVGEFLVAQALAQVNLSIDDVETVVLPLPEISPALANGAVDGAYLFVPYAHKSFADGVSVPLLSGSEIAGQLQVTSLIAGARLLETDNREITVRVFTAIYKAIQQDLGGADFLKDDEISAIVQKYTSLPLPVINNSPPSGYTYDGKVDAESIARIQTYYLEQGYLDYSDPLTIDEIADQSFLEEALRRLEQTGE